MTLPSFALLDDLEARIGPVDDVTRAEAALDRASTLIRVEAGVDWVNEDGDAIDFGTLRGGLQDAIRGICVDVARRQIDSPLGVRSESLGDAAITYDDPAGNAYLTKEEKATIRTAITPSGGVPGLASVRVVAPAAAAASRLLYASDDQLAESDPGS